MFNKDKIDSDEANAVLKEVSKIFTVSDNVGKEIIKLYPEFASKIRTIYSEIDTDLFLPGSQSNIIKKRNDIRIAHGLENKTVILYAEGFSRNQGVDRLEKALQELSKPFDDLALVIVGNKWISQNDVSDFVDYLRALATKLPIPVVTTGFVASSEIQNWFAAADLFVYTSLWSEPWTRIHSEAMTAGFPIITTERDGNAELIPLGENSLVVENPENSSFFLEKISEVLTNKAWMKKTGEKGRELALSLYKWDQVASEIIEVWENSKQTTTVLNSKTENVVGDYSKGNLIEQTVNVIEDHSIITERIKKSTERERIRTITIEKSSKRKKTQTKQVEKSSEHEMSDTISTNEYIKELYKVSMLIKKAKKND